MLGMLRLSKRFRCAVLCAAIWGCGALPVQALNPNHRLTQYLHRIWQSQPGLPQTSIYSLIQTRDGYLWVGTQSGVVRFDGLRFASIPALEKASLGTTWFRKMAEDAAGRVWLLSDGAQLARLDKGTLRIFNDVRYTCLFAGQKGIIWACTPSGLVSFDGDNRELHQGQGPFPWGGGIVAGCQSHDKSIWVVAGPSVIKWDRSVYAKVPLRYAPADGVIRNVLCEEDAVWFAGSKGLVRLGGGRETVYTVSDGLADNIVISLGHRAGGGLWAGTRNGISRVSPDGKGGFVIESLHEGLSQNTVLALREDREGSLWVATGYGLNQFLDGAATRYTMNEGLPSGNPGPILVDRQGKLWAGALDGGLAVFDGKGFTPVAGPGIPPVRALTEGSNGEIWAGTESGIFRIQNAHLNGVYTVADGLPSNRIRALFRDHAGQIWAGTELGPAVLRDGRFVRDAALATNLSSAPISAIGETDDGEVLLAVARGSLYGYRDGRLRRFGSDKSRANTEMANNDPAFSQIISIYTDPQGTTWIGTNGVGVATLRGGVLNRFFIPNGLIDPEIYGFVVDTRNRLWMAGSLGVFWIPKGDFADFATGKLKRLNPLPYRPLDGARPIQGTPEVSPVEAVTKDGRLWLSTSDALLGFELDRELQRVIPPAVVEQVSVNGAEFLPDEVRALGPGRENVAIDYTALTFLAPQFLRFRYMLDGYDKDWTNAGGRRQAFYTNLPPGRFRFRLAVCAASSLPCQESGSPFTFEITPQFYQRDWFVPALAGLLSLLTWLGYRLRVRQIRSQFNLVLAERGRIARELHDTLIQGFSGITMQLQALKMRVRSEDEKHTLDEIVRDAGICLQETRRSVAGLRGATGAGGGLAAALTDVARQTVGAQDIRLKLRVEDNQEALPAEVKYNLVCIAQEALTNVIKHSGARNIEVSLTGARRELLMTIQDDGNGLQRPGGPGHYGMLGMSERAHNIGAEFRVVTNPGAGTTISVCLPLAKQSVLAAHPRRVETTS